MLLIFRALVSDIQFQHLPRLSELFHGLLPIIWQLGFIKSRPMEQGSSGYTEESRHFGAEDTVEPECIREHNPLAYRPESIRLLVS